VNRTRPVSGLVSLVLTAVIFNISVFTLLAQRPQRGREGDPTPTPTASPAATATPIVAANPQPSVSPTPNPTPDPTGSGVYSGLRFRNIGPAVTSGRVNAFAV